MDAMPSQVRQKILAEHTELRAKLLRLELLLDHIPPGNEGWSGPVESAVLQLVEALKAHMQRENELLLPILRGIDAWGPDRALQLEQEHHHQQVDLAVLVGKLEGGALQPVMALAREFIALLRADMEFEEQEFLGANLLRDDLVTADAVDA